MVSAQGSSGGLATLWTEDKYQLNKIHETQHWIFTELTQLASKLTISLVNLCVPVNYSEKREEEAERLKRQGSQSTIEMTIGRNSRPKSSKGGSTPLLGK